MSNIYLLRHGKVSGEAALYGHSDVEVAADIDEKIVEQFSSLNLDIDSVITSPLKRCFNLAKLLCKESQLPLTSVAQLKEMNFGLYDGVPFDELHQDKNIWQSLERFWQNPVQHPLPKAELLTGFSYRVINAWQKIVENIIREQSGKSIVVVCHGGVIRMILAHLLNIDFRNPLWYTNLSIANGSLTSIEVPNKHAQIKQAQIKQARVKQIAKPLLVQGTALLKPATEFNFPYSLLNKIQREQLQGGV
ncbi:MAG: histidine phosphatase family protein [Thalassotalea sp.]|nr:histidine phosphatase family protein [Thalassotalea sp.]